MFRFDPDADTSETYLVDTVEVPPASLVARFGPPGRGTDDGKLSGCYRFTNSCDDVFTVYDWKATTRYYGNESDWPTPEEFWSEVEPVELNIGGHGEENSDGLNLAVTAFREWLLEQCRGYDSRAVN